MSVKVHWKCDGCGKEATTEPKEGGVHRLPGGWYFYYIHTDTKGDPANKKTNPSGIECGDCVAEMVAATIKLLTPGETHRITLEPWYR